MTRYKKAFSTALLLCMLILTTLSPTGTYAAGSAAPATTVNFNEGASAQVVTLPIYEGYGYWKLTIQNNGGIPVRVRFVKQSPDGEPITEIMQVPAWSERVFYSSSALGSGIYYINIWNAGEEFLKGRIQYQTADAETALFCYSDTQGTEYEKAVWQLSAYGVLNGYEDGTFRPDETVTRAEMAKILTSALRANISEEGEAPFTDTQSHWALPYIHSAWQQGIIKGDSDGQFRPDDTVSPAEAVTMLLRTLGYTNVTGSWPENYYQQADALGIAYGTDSCRGTIAVMLDSVLDFPLFGHADETLRIRVSAE